MNIIVCVKQVPDTNDIKIDPVKGTLIREGVPSIINPEDNNAIEAALQIKGEGKVTVLSMGPPQAEEALREAIAMGVDEAILVSDFKFAGSDTWATANVLASAVKKLDYDLIICGRQAIDGDTAQVGPQLAENLGLPQITYVQKIEVGEGVLKVQRALEDGYEIIEGKLPVLITVVKEINNPRYPTLQGIDKAYETDIIKWTADDIEADPAKIGLKGSPTHVKKSFVPPGKGQGIKLDGPTKDIAKQLIGILKEKEIIQEF
jgi:electron transfer flavoprotein alpha/beta subunit